MTQAFTDIPSTNTLQSSRSLLLNNTKTAISNNSGAAFPTANLEEGWTCFRTDVGQKIMYTYNGASWDKLAAGRLWDQDLDDGSFLTSSQFVRSDVADTISGSLTLSNATYTFSNVNVGLLLGGTSTAAKARIIRNDGGGHFNLRAGSYFSTTEKYANTGDGACHIRMQMEGTEGSLEFRVAPTGTAGTTITYAHTLTLDTTAGFSLDGNTILHAGNHIAGTHYQAFNQSLEDISGLTPSAGDMIIRNSGDTAWVTENLTATAREYTRTQNFNATTLTSSAGAVVWNASQNQVASLSMTENTVISAPTSLVDGAMYLLRVTQHSSSSFTLGFNSVFKFEGGDVPILTTTNNAVDIFIFLSDGTNMYNTGTIQDIK